jgi:hypothetical protein
MTKGKAAELLKAMFPNHERQFLLTHPKFKKAVRLAPDDCLFELSHFGVQILHERSMSKAGPRQRKVTLPIRQSLCVAFMLAAGISSQTCRFRESVKPLDERDIPQAAGFEAMDAVPRIHWS